MEGFGWEMAQEDPYSREPVQSIFKKKTARTGPQMSGQPPHWPDGASQLCMSGFLLSLLLCVKPL